jgi:S-adenosylmethionine/arginine decarboxylase-like enzyme
MSELVHQHLIVSAEVERDTVSASELGDWLLRVAGSVGMRAITEPVISYSDSPGNTGYLGILGISTSHLSVHHWDCCTPSLLQFDLYSCRAYQVTAVLKEIDVFWRVRSGQIAVIERGQTYSAGLDLSMHDFRDLLRAPEKESVQGGRGCQGDSLSGEA